MEAPGEADAVLREYEGCFTNRRFSGVVVDPAAEFTAAAAAAVLPAGEPVRAELAVTGNPPPVRGCTPPGRGFAGQHGEASAERGERVKGTGVGVAGAVSGDEIAVPFTEATGAVGAEAAVVADSPAVTERVDSGDGFEAEAGFAISACAFARLSSRKGDP